MARVRKPKLYGYARISTQKQSIERQIRNIKAEYPDALIYQEAYTGTKADRPEFAKLLKAVQAGDTIVFDSVSRMSRNAEEGIQLYFRLYDMGVNLVFLKEGYINTDTYRDSINQSIGATGNEIADIYIEATNKVIKILAEKQIEKAFEQSEKEVKDLQQRTREGIETARRAGKQIGQQGGKALVVKKAEPIKEAILKYSKDFNGTNTDPECIAIINTLSYEYTANNRTVTKPLRVSRNTYYKYKAELREAAYSDR